MLGWVNGLSHWCSVIYGVMALSPSVADLLPAARIAWCNQAWPWPGGPKSTGYYPENRSKLLIMRGMRFSSSVVSPGAWGFPVKTARNLHKGVPPEQSRTTYAVLLAQCWQGTGCPRGIGVVGRVQRLCALAEARRNGHWRELWHGS